MLSITVIHHDLGSYVYYNNTPMGYIDKFGKAHVFSAGLRVGMTSAELRHHVSTNNLVRI